MCSSPSSTIHQRNLIANDADPNYFHEFKYHSKPGLLKYSKDVPETVNLFELRVPQDERETQNSVGNTVLVYML